MKINKQFLFLTSLISAMGGLLFGYDWVVIGGAKPFYEVFFGISESTVLQGWAMSSALVGCLIGALMAAMLSDRYGRKKMLILSAVLFLLSAVGTGLTSNFDVFIIWRIIGGLGIGLASNLSPMYIAEISPAQYRGRFVSLNQLTIVLGILLAQVVNLLVSDKVVEGATAADIAASWNGQTGWRWMFWAEAVPAILFLFMAMIIPESPRWLVMKNRKEQAQMVLERVGGREFAIAEVGSIAQSFEGPKSTKMKMLFKKGMVKLLTIGVVLAVFQQWCGINVVFNYAQEIFKSAGYGVSDTLFNIVITGVTNLVFTVLAIMLIDRWGRRPLLIFGSAALTIIYAVLGLVFYMQATGIFPVILVLMAIAAYAMTLAAVMWVVISEIFPSSIRATAMAISTGALWSACFILTYTFPILNSSLGTYGTFWIYGLISALGLLFILKNVKETKGLSLEEIEIQSAK